MWNYRKTLQKCSIILHLFPEEIDVKFVSLQFTSKSELEDDMVQISWSSSH